jgi:RNA polymerase sigma factor (sigma-70 family)
MSRLDKLITTLSPRAQQVVRFAYFEGMRNCDIARLLYIREKTVSNIKERAIEKLRLKLAGKPTLARTLKIWRLELASGV